MTDVTDSAMLRSKLMHAEKMAAVGQLVSGVAHEVNNPLTAILGFTDLLMENPELPESARRDLRVILQEAQRTKQIVQNLLSFARQMPPQRQPVQLNSILQRTVHLRSYDFISHGIQVVERLDESLPQVIGDSHQLQQVFLNILNNAYDAVRETARPARIEIMSARPAHSSRFLFAITARASSIPNAFSILSLPPKTWARARVWASVFAMASSANMAVKLFVTTTWTPKERPLSFASRWQPRQHPLEPLQECIPK
jgi:nitrogen-specific signal transduction histidine kinase